MVTWKQAESGEKVAELDLKSSPNGIYVRKNIEEIITKDDSGTENKKYSYQEAFMTKSEYENYCLENNIVNKILDIEDTPEYKEYEKNLETPVQYVNGCFYKPIWIDIYDTKIDRILNKAIAYEKAGGDASVIYGMKTLIYDATGKLENAKLMGLKEVIDLYMFLTSKQEEFYQEYKAKKAGEKQEE